MPIYEYRCLACSERFSKFYRSVASAQQASPPTCPACGSEKVQRLVSPFATAHPSGADPAETAYQRAQEERAASITPREQIERWRKSKPKR